MGTAVFAEQAPRVEVVAFAAADTTVAKAVFNQGEQPSRMDVLLATNTGIGAIDFKLGWRVISFAGATSDWYVQEFSVPAGAGFGAVAPYDVLAGLAVPLQAGLLNPGQRPIIAAAVTTLGGTDTVTFFASGGVL